MKIKCLGNDVHTVACCMYSVHVDGGGMDKCTCNGNIVSYMLK